MAIKKVKSPTQLEYEKQLRRVKQFIYRAEKRGYTFSTNLIPKRPKKITEGSVRRLQKLTPDYLYSKATAKTEQGKTITGKQKRVQERIQSAKKGGHTRKRNLEKARKQREYKEREKNLFAPNDSDIEERRRKQDKIDRELAETGEFDDGVLTLQQLRDMIDRAKSNNQRGGYKLEELLNSCLAVNRTQVLINIGKAHRDTISQAYELIHYWGTDRGYQAYASMYEIMTGHTMSAQESAEASDIYEENNMYVDENEYITVVKSEDNPWD